MPRACNVCSSDDRARIEEALAKGATFVSVSREARFSMLLPDAIERHWRNHVAPDLRDSRTAPGASPVALADSMLELLDSARAVRLRAADSGHDGVVLRAVQVEAGLRRDMIDRLGIEPQEARAALDQMADLRANVAAVMQAVRKRPDLGELVAVELDAMRRTDDADGMRRLVSRIERQREITS